VHHERHPGGAGRAVGAAEAADSRGRLCDAGGGARGEFVGDCDGVVAGEGSEGGGVELFEHECFWDRDGRVDECAGGGEGGGGVGGDGEGVVGRR